MYLSDTEEDDLLSEFKFFQLYKQMLQDAVISEVHKICEVLHFLEIREFRERDFSNLANLYRIYNVLHVSNASAGRNVNRLKQIKNYTSLTIDEIRLSDLSVLNIKKEFSENVDFNTFLKMMNRRKQLV